MTELDRRKNKKQQFTAREADDRIDLNRIARILLGGRWWIIASVGVALLLAIFYLLTTPNSYSADALLQIESDNSSPLSGLVGSSDPSSLGGQRGSPAQSQIPIIKSRNVLGQTVKDLNLAVHTSQNRTPIIGALFNSGNSSIVVSRFDIPDALRGANFQLTLKDDKHFQLANEQGKAILSGTVGQAADGRTPMGDKVSIFVRSAVLAKNKPATFTLKKRAWLAQVNSLAGGLTVEEVTPGSGILSLSMTGSNREFITQVVNSVAQNYVQQNVEARSKNAEQSLKFLDKQLPELKSDVDAAEAKLATYQEKHQPVDLSAEANSLLQRVANLEDKRSQLRLKIAELKQGFTNEYPEVKAAQEQLQELSQQDNKLQNKINGLPSSQKQMLGLQRDLKVNTQLYTSLMNRAQELRVVKAGTIGNVRIVDPAVLPVKPIWPNTKLVLFVFIVLGLLVGIGIVVLKTAMRRGLIDAAEIEGKTGYPVYSVVPYSDWLRRAGRRRRKGESEPLLARDNPQDMVVEALRSLRTSLHFAQMESGSNILLMTGPSPGVGKSFLSMNLGHLLADTDQRVVVVDADMRRGRIHQFLYDKTRNPGLSDVLGGGQQWGDVLRPVEGSNLQVVTSGTIPPNPSELLLRERFRATIDALAAEFDIVIVDAPPVLAVTDAGVIASALGSPMAFMVLRSGMHPAEEIDEAISRFSRQGGTVNGLVLNHYSPKAATATRGYGHYQYKYASEKS